MSVSEAPRAPLVPGHLPLQKGDVVSLVGSGGKTTLMYCLAQALTRQGMRVITTTTTKILPPHRSESPHLIVTDNEEMLVEEARSLFKQSYQVTLAREPKEEKLKGFSPSFIDTLHEKDLADIILVEADGARKLPLKAPNESEPVIPSSTTWTLAVVGLEGIGKPNSEDYVFRPDYFSRLTGIKIGDTVTPEAVARVILHPEGLLRGTPEQARVAVILNKGDVEGAFEQGTKIAHGIMQATHRRIVKILVTTLLPCDHLLRAFYTEAKTGVQ